MIFWFYSDIIASEQSIEDSPVTEDLVLDCWIKPPCWEKLALSGLIGPFPQNFYLFPVSAHPTSDCCDRLFRPLDPRGLVTASSDQLSHFKLFFDISLTHN